MRALPALGWGGCSLSCCWSGFVDVGQNRAVVVSFNLEAIATIKALDASIRTGALFALARGGKGWRAEKIIKGSLDSGADEILLHRLLARPKLIAKAIDANLPIVVWTVDDSKWISRAETLGIRALITNDPAKLLSYRRNMR